MDFLSQRKPGGAKYGRNNRKTVVHNFFAEEVRSVPVATALPISPSSPGTEQHSTQTLQSLPSPTTLARPAHITSHSPSPVPKPDPLRSRSPAKSDSSPASHDQSMYEMGSSGDEMTPRLKRRKLTPLAPIARTEVTTDVPKTASRALTRKLENIPVAAPKPGIASGAAPKPARKNAQTSGTSQKELSDARLPMKTNLSPKATTADSAKPALQDNANRRKLKTKPTKRVAPIPSVDVDMDLRDSTDDDVADSRPRTPSPPTIKANRTLRRKSLVSHRPEFEGGFGKIESPSRLPMSDLSLSSWSRQESPGSDKEKTPRQPMLKQRPRGRRRLIDRLDAPESSSNNEEYAQPGHSATETNDTISPDPVLSRPQAPTLKRGGSSGKQTYGRSRATYAKERSHLSSMVDDVDMLQNPQHSSQELASQLTMASAPSQIQLDMSMDESSETDSAAGGKLKSIHELRQAGANQKFSRELESLLEDIDPTTRGTSKSLRLQALIKLVQKLPTPSFASTVRDHGLTRLSSWASKLSDPATATLLVIVFWKLCHVAHNTSTHLEKTFDGVVICSEQLLTSHDTFSKIIKNRKLNLSGAVVRDLAEFEATLMKEELIPSYENRQLVPAVVTLAALNDIVRCLVDQEAHDVQIPASRHESIVALLQKCAIASETEFVSSEHTFLVKTALSLWQSCSGPLNDDLGLTSTTAQKVGTTLAQLRKSLDTQEEQGGLIVMHLALSLCNDRSHICEGFARSDLPSYLVTSVGKVFKPLVLAAEDEIDIDGSTIDSMVLELACLFKISEHDNSVRKHIATTDITAGQNTLSYLVDLYMTALPKLTDASTIRKSQLAVVLGYLALVICTLSLHESNRVAIEGKIPLGEVRKSMEELLAHLCRLQLTNKIDESDNNVSFSGDGAADDFTKSMARVLGQMQSIG